jgi:hypothetical protein
VINLDLFSSLVNVAQALGLIGFGGPS